MRTRACRVSLRRLSCLVLACAPCSFGVVVENPPDVFKGWLFDVNYEVVMQSFETRNNYSLSPEQSCSIGTLIGLGPVNKCISDGIGNFYKNGCENDGPARIPYRDNECSQIDSELYSIYTSKGFGEHGHPFSYVNTCNRASEESVSRMCAPFSTYWQYEVFQDPECKVLFPGGREPKEAGADSGIMYPVDVCTGNSLYSCDEGGVLFQVSFTGSGCTGQSQKTALPRMCVTGTEPGYWVQYSCKKSEPWYTLNWGVAFGAVATCTLTLIAITYCMYTKVDKLLSKEAARQEKLDTNTSVLLRRALKSSASGVSKK